VKKISEIVSGIVLSAVWCNDMERRRAGAPGISPDRQNWRRDPAAQGPESTLPINTIA